MPPRGEHLLTHSMVTKLIEGNHEKGHVVVIDNYFTLVDFYEDWHCMGQCYRYGAM